MIVLINYPLTCLHKKLLNFIDESGYQSTFHEPRKTHNFPFLSKTQTATQENL